MRKIQPENLKIMISNLTEAAGDLCELEARLDYMVNDRMPKGWEGFDRIWDRHPFLTSTLYVIFEHVYHHINFAWNSRFVSASRVIACARRDYERWEKFPDDFTPLKALRKTKHARPVFDGDLNLFNLRMNVRESMIFLDGVIKEIHYHPTRVWSCVAIRSLNCVFGRSSGLSASLTLREFRKLPSESPETPCLRGLLSHVLLREVEKTL